MVIMTTVGIKNKVITGMLGMFYRVMALERYSR